MGNPAPRFLAITVAIVSLAASSCGDPGEVGRDKTAPQSNGYVVERSAADGVETVRTVSGSRWGAPASLVEALAIGDEIADEAYLFGSITGAWATDDRIYVIDAQVPAVRAYDLGGEHLFDVGSAGQGPGEYIRPEAIAVTDDGRVAVADAMNARISIYDAEGALVEDWPLASQKSALGLSLSYDGEMYTQSWSNDEGRMGMQAVGPDGLRGEILFPPSIAFEPATVSVGKGLVMIVPFAPAYTWAFAPGGEMVAGVGEHYSFEIHRPSGTSTVVERDGEPVPVSPREAQFRARLASDAIRRISPDGSLSSAEVAPHKSAFTGFHTDRAGRVWVVRQGPGRQDPSCIDATELANPALLMATNAGTYVEIGGKLRVLGSGATDDDALEGGCWTDTFTFDLFDIVTGDFLGTIDAPEHGFRIPLFADADTVLAAVADELGTVRLKRYRLQID
jgi:hypothetical protein